MPIYEYQCTLCGEHCEQLQKVSDAPLTECPACGKSGLQKMVSSTSFQLKGSGWYVTDFRDKNKPKPTEKTESKSSTKTDSKKSEDT